MSLVFLEVEKLGTVGFGFWITNAKTRRHFLQK